MENIEDKDNELALRLYIYLRQCFPEGHVKEPSFYPYESGFKRHYYDPNSVKYQPEFEFCLAVVQMMQEMVKANKE